jgi:serine/threonine protein kinase
VSDPQLAAFETAIADRWVIDADVGRGSRATVYRARDVASGEAVAIKVFRPDLASAVDSKRFLAQMRTTAGIRHENIVPILEVNDVAGRLFYEMLAGEPPFAGDKLTLLRKTVTEMPVPITGVRDTLPPDVDVTLDRLLAKAPAARYPDAAHLVDALSTLESRSSTNRA